jgi:small-conductance mechanosensitive channel
MKNPFNGLLFELWVDLREPGILWQVAVLAVCLGAAWVLARASRPDLVETSGVWKLGVGGLKRILFPLLALVLVLIARPILAHWHHVNLLRLAVPLLGSLALIRVLVYLLRHAFASGGTVAVFERLIAAAVWGVVALHIVGVLPDVTEYLEGEAVVIGRQRISLWLILQALFWCLSTLLVALWAGSAIEARLMRAETLHSSLRVVLSRVAKALLVMIALLIVLPLAGIDVTVLSVFGGALGVGLGFGLQKIASNYVSGFIILLDRSVELGDIITADNFHGKLTQITTRYVVVRSPDGREAIIPNETLITQTVVNHTHTDAAVRLATQVQIDYAADLEQAMRLLVDVARRHPRVLAEPPPAALLNKFADSGIDLELGFWIGDPENGSGNIRSDINVAICRAFAAAGVGIAYPHMIVAMDLGETRPSA